MASLGTIGALNVEIDGDISPLQKKLGVLSKEAEGLGGRLRATTSAVVALGAAAAAAGAVFAATIVARTMQSIDAHAKLARQLGATNKGLTTAAHAANLAGASQEQLTAALRRLDVATGQALTGSKEVAEIFQRLRISADEVSAMDADQRISVLNDRIKEFIPEAERAYVASQLFGRTMGKAMSELDSEAMAVARREVEALGLAVSEIDSNTIERANDAMTSIGEVARGVANRFTVAVAPAVEAVAVALRDSAIEAEGFKGGIERAVEVAITVVGKLLDVFHGLRLAISGLQWLGQEWIAGWTSLFATFGSAVQSMLDGILVAINATIRALNVLPGVNIAEIVIPGEREWKKKLDLLASSTKETATESRLAFETLAAKELPSEGIRAYLDKVKASAAEASAAVEAARQGRRVERSGGGGDPEQDKAAEAAAAAALAEEERMQAEITRLQDHVMQRFTILSEGILSEEEQRMLAHERQLQELNEALGYELITAEEHQRVREALEKKHMDELGKIRQRGWTDIQKFENATLSQQAKQVADHLAGITSGVARHNRTMFEVNKVAGIAQAIVNAYIGISKTLSQYPFPLNVGLAAAHAAVAFAQVNAIRSQQFESGGAAPSLAGSTPAPAVTPVGQTDTSAGGGGGGLDRTVTVQGISDGELFSGGRMKGLIEALLEEQRNGARVVLV